MSLQTRLEALVAAIGADIKQINTNISAGAPTGTKVSALPAVATLDGTELVPVVQGGATKQVASSKLQPWRGEQILTTTYSNDTVTASDVFSGFAPAANTRYLVDVFLLVQSVATTTGVQTALAGPASGVTRAGVTITSAASATTQKIDYLALGAFQIATAGLTTPTPLIIQGLVDVGAAPGAGNIKVQAKAEVAGTGAIQIFPGSSMRWRIV